MLRKRNNTLYSDNFSARSFVSHSANVKKDELKEIDLLPKMKDKALLTAELSPTFTKKDDDLIEVLGILTRVLDGNGYESDSGVHGHRGYSEPMMFVWIGAPVDIPHKVHKYLGTLGPKLYFMRIPKSRKTEEEYYLQAISDSYNKDMKEIQSALTDYLDYFGLCPNAVLENDLVKIEWDSKDEPEAIRMIVKLSILLAHLRGTVTTWKTEEGQGLNYCYATAVMEEPDRAVTQLRNLARGHALSTGRRYITIEDIPMIVKVVLSTASIERTNIFDLLIAFKGKLTTLQITISLNISKPTAERTMAEFQALGLVTVAKGPHDNSEVVMTLNPEYDWFLKEEFLKLREGFVPADYSEYIKMTKIMTVREEEGKKEDLYTTYEREFGTQSYWDTKYNFSANKNIRYSHRILVNHLIA